MISTDKLYGVPPVILHALIGSAIHKAICNTRINILKDNLKKVTQEDSSDPFIKDIQKAIEHWEALMEEK